MLFGAKISVLALKEKSNVGIISSKKKCSRFQNFLLNRFLCLEIKSFDIFLERYLRRCLYQMDLKIYTYIPKYSKCEHTLYFIISDRNRKK